MKNLKKTGNRAVVSFQAPPQRNLKNIVRPTSSDLFSNEPSHLDLASQRFDSGCFCQKLARFATRRPITANG
jgi:hypothetical protein